MRIKPDAAHQPRARRGELVVQELAGETLVYDQERHRAHCLAATVAWVWRHCDGRTAPAVLAERLSRARGAPVDEEVVRVALHRLARARLLEGPPPPASSLSLRSRRELLKRVALLGGLSVLSMAAPTAGQAASCVSSADCDLL